MPNTRSGRKWMRKDVKRRLRNRATKSALKTLIKRFKDTVATGDQDKIKLVLAEVAKKFDQAAAKDILHKNKADRVKSRAAAYAKKKAPPAAAAEPAAAT